MCGSTENELKTIIMAFKMKGAPMHDLSSKHGTNANYQKSGAPGLMDFAKKVADPLGLFGKKGGRGKPCPPAVAAAPVAEAVATPGVEGAGPATPPVVDPNAGVSGQGTPAMPMKKNLKVGATEYKKATKK